MVEAFLCLNFMLLYVSAFNLLLKVKFDLGTKTLGLCYKRCFGLKYTFCFCTEHDTDNVLTTIQNIYFIGTKITGKYPDGCSCLHHPLLRFLKRISGSINSLFLGPTHKKSTFSPDPCRKICHLDC